MEEIKNPAGNMPIPSVNPDAQTTFAPKKSKMSILGWIVAFILLIAVFVLGFFVWQMQKKNKEISAQNIKLQQDQTSLETKYTEIEINNNSNLQKIDEINQQVSQLQAENKAIKEKSSATCANDNACKFRTPFSEFRCDASSKYSESGAYLCSCDFDCNVVRK